MAATRPIGGTPQARWMARAAAMLLSLLGVAWSPPAAAQRVQIPTQNPAAFGAPPGPAAAPPSFGGATLATPGAIGPPPAFDPYAAGTVVGPMSPAPYSFGTPATVPPVQPFGPPAPLAQPVPYAQTVPFGQAAPLGGQAQAFPSQAAPQPAPLFSEGLPLGWEPGSYRIEGLQDAGVQFTKFVQKLDGEYTHLFGGGSPSDLELDRVEITSTFAWPLFGDINNPVLITPGFVYNRFDDGLFIRDNGFPDETYEAFLDAAWFPRFNERVGAELGFQTGVWSDFREVNSDSIRILGHGMAVVAITDRAEVLVGVVYLDRERIKLLPAGGVRWRPTDTIEVNAVFPYPVIRRRLRTAGTNDWWLYVAGEYGGAAWTTREAPTGFDYNDIRLSLGLEFETQRRVSGRFEVGYVFEREFYLLGPRVIEFEDTVMLRAGINL